MTRGVLIALSPRGAPPRGTPLEVTQGVLLFLGLQPVDELFTLLECHPLEGLRSRLGGEVARSIAPLLPRAAPFGTRVV